MPDDLTISGGTSVETEDLVVSADQLGRLRDLLSEQSSRLRALEGQVATGSRHAIQAGIDITVAREQLDELAGRAGRLSWVLSHVVTTYRYADEVAGSVLSQLAQAAAGAVGRAAFLAAIASPLPLLALAGLVVTVRSAGIDRKIDAAFGEKGLPKTSPAAQDHNELINNSTTATLIRGTSELVGPALWGAIGVPPELTKLAGNKVFESGAAGLMALGSTVGLLKETPVKLVGTERVPRADPPAGFADRLDRVPSVAGESGPQIVIERYTVPGEDDRYEVYVGGTVTFSPTPTDEPWDMTSNLANAAGLPSGSGNSVILAMQEAGITPDSPVQFTGYSQGGGTVAQLAASGLFNTQGLVTFGGPTGNVPIPPDFPTVLVEHSDDLVPALGGDQGNRDAVLVRRNVFGGMDLPDQYAVPSHRLEYYEETAKLMDENRSPQLADSIDKLDAFTKGATLASSEAYQFQRVEERVSETSGPR